MPSCLNSKLLESAKASGLNRYLPYLKSRSKQVKGVRYELRVAAEYADRGAQSVIFRKSLRQNKGRASDMDLLIDGILIVEAKRTAQAVNPKEIVEYLKKLLANKVGSPSDVTGVSKFVLEGGEDLGTLKLSNLENAADDLIKELAKKGISVQFNKTATIPKP